MFAFDVKTELIKKEMALCSFTTTEQKAGMGEPFFANFVTLVEEFCFLPTF